MPTINLTKPSTPFVHLLFSILLGLHFVSFGQTRVVIGSRDGRPLKEISGIVVDNASNEALVGVTFYFPELKKGVASDQNGRFLFELPEGTHPLEVSLVGYKKKDYVLIILGKGTFNVRLVEDFTELGEVVISSRREDENVKSADMGKDVLSLTAITQLPAFVGEVDVLKSLTLLPGISSAGEASSGFNVRGGGADQNLILLGNGALYNSSHFFGFFSSFNSDIVRDVTIYKAGIPAYYGGRSSSIVDIQYKDGNYQNFGGSLSAGLISSKVTLEGPIIKDKLSVIGAGRVSYANWFLRRARDPQVRDSRINFWDGNLIFNYLIGEKHKLTYSYYRSFDDYKLIGDTTISWTNQIHTLALKSEWTDKISTDISIVNSLYDYSILSDFRFAQFDLTSSINDLGINAGMRYQISPKSTVYSGFQSKMLSISPGNFTIPDDSPFNPFRVPTEQGLESAVYFHHDLELSNVITFSYGLRYSWFNYLGAGTVYEYAENRLRTIENIVDSTVYGSGEKIVSYGGLEPRLSMRVGLNNSTSLKVGYNRMLQYIQIISNTTSISPTDVWKLSDPFLRPATVDQYSAGFFKNFLNNAIETSAEVYYKSQQNLTEYKDGADLFLNEHLETELLNAEGKAYGLELYMKKNKGRNRGWVSYTYSRSYRRVIGNFPEETINNGDWFRSNFDKPHDFTAVFQHRISPFLDFSSIFTYSTGRPSTFPIGKFRYSGETMAYFDLRNMYRMPDYHRLDLSLDIRFNAIKKIYTGDWKLSLYNVYGRRNAFSLFFDDRPGAPPQAYQLAVLGAPFLSLAYSLKF